MIRPRSQFVGALLLATGASVLLLIIDGLRDHDWQFLYFIWNLFLAWLPLLFSSWLVNVLQRKLWSSWEALLASVLWLLFLPNSFYMVSDFIHLQDARRGDLLYDVVMFTAFIFTGVALGVVSLYMVHQEFNKRFSPRTGTVWLGAIFLLCSFAIYLGRDLRWNSWDILTNPGGLLFDVSDRLLHPRAYPGMLLTTFVFFILIGSIYLVAWQALHLSRSSNRQEHYRLHPRQRPKL